MQVIHGNPPPLLLRLKDIARDLSFLLHSTHTVAPVTILILVRL